MTNIANGKLLTELKDEAESGQMLAFIGYPSVAWFCKLKTGYYACVCGEIGSLRSGAEDDFNNFAPCVEHLGLWLVTMPNWIVTLELPLCCSDCGLPSLGEGSLDSTGLCFDCREDRIPLHGKAKPVATSYFHMKQAFTYLCESIDALQPGQAVPSELTELFQSMASHLDAVKNMIEIFYADPAKQTYDSIEDIFGRIDDIPLAFRKAFDEPGSTSNDLFDL